jgi:hypothetical protein
VAGKQVLSGWSDTGTYLCEKCYKREEEIDKNEPIAESKNPELDNLQSQKETS